MTIFYSSGVVVGILTSDYEIDMARMAIVRATAYPMMLTFHRAFDVCVTDIRESIRQVLDLGCDRLLTSGRSPSAELGSDTLREIVNARDEYLRANPHMPFLRVVAAAGVSVSNAADIISSSGVDGIHAASSVLKKAVQRDPVVEDGPVDDDVVKFSVAVKDFDDDCSAGMVCVKEVSVLVDEAENAWVGNQL